MLPHATHTADGLRARPQEKARGALGHAPEPLPRARQSSGDRRRLDPVRQHAAPRQPHAPRELGILRGAQVSASEYEWAQHLRMARKAGVREAQIAALAGWRASPEFDAKEKAALQLAESVTSGRVSDEVYREAMRHLDQHDYVELAVTAGFYAMVARVLDAMGVELEPDFRDYRPKLP